MIRRQGGKRRLGLAAARQNPSLSSDHKIIGGETGEGDGSRDPGRVVHPVPGAA
ncbi:hypothetical protein [Pararhodobacter sp.]|uniref:hypothetical protein n=1 Tax=Pararhodobacter sp. TaxID=2127056 RepID=UPI002AFEAA8D|nr:hypothetical protein [Pararhodobacter sp.]